MIVVQYVPCTEDEQGYFSVEEMWGVVVASSCLFDL